MLGERIALLRRGRGWSQAELAELLHISPSAVGMYEQGRREPSLTAVVQIARAFSVSVDYLLTGRTVCPGDRAVMQQVIRATLEQPVKRQHLSREEVEVLMAAMLTEA